jgi:hypothetical protein
MKTPMTTLVVFGAVVMTAAPSQAQLFGRRAAKARQPAASAPAARSAVPAPAPLDPKVVQANGSTVPGATPAEELKPLTMDLPDDPIEPYLLTKTVGPYLVLAKTFRGEQAERMALALAKELRQDYQLPAHILRTKDFPGKSNIRGIPPTAEPEAQRSRLSLPEKVRTYDEAAVMVGDEKTQEAADQLWKRVKKIKPKCLNEMPKLFALHEGLSRAMITTNPYVPAQYLFPKKKDKLLISMNSGRQSVTHCPGRYSLLIADFTGRSTFKTQDDHWSGAPGALKALHFLKSSPLATAADDAELLADKLAKQPEIQKLGQPLYVYHDRTSSKVYIGSFEAADDPKAVALRDNMLENSLKFCDAKRPGGPLEKIIVPASHLTDVGKLKEELK